MTTIVMNTLNGAVTEYDWSFQSITPTHAGDASGLYLLGGDLDDQAKIDSLVMTGKTLWGDTHKKFVPVVYFSMVGIGQGTLHVNGYKYKFPVLASGQSRRQPGAGIRENYLEFGYGNVNGADFRIDRIEVPLEASVKRKV